MGLKENRTSKVYLVGAGPGDPGLLTLRGRALLEIADVVIYDYLADSSLLGYVRSNCVLIDVGKRPNRPMPQSEINTILADSCSTYEHVVRLKGGDPMLFGRGGEELIALESLGVPYEVVPGVSSALAVPTYAGIPVTHRGVSTSLTVITGHRQGGASDDTNYHALVQLGGTLVVLMGVEHRAKIASQLIAAGMDPKTLVAAIRWGTRLDQITVRGQLDVLAELDVRSPSVIVIGDVAGFNFNFFESRPLFGKSVVVTRGETQQKGFSSKLADLGAKVVLAPTIEIAPPSDSYELLDNCIKDLALFDLLIFTSINAVLGFFSRLDDLRVLGHLKIVAVGTSTAEAIAKYRIGVDIIPDSFVAESLIDALPNANGARVLIPRSEIARDVLPDGLRSKGYDVVTAPTYTTKRYVDTQLDPNTLREADAVCFTSSSTAKNFVESYGLESLPSLVISIGPITSQTLRALGVSDISEAKVHDLDGLLRALVEAVARKDAHYEPGRN